MPTIIAGRFDNFETAGKATETLIQRNFNHDDVTTFYVGPPGQHARYPVGGDHDEDAKATEADSNGLKGAAIGAGVGLAAVAAGPVGVAVGVVVGMGAYTGALVGALQGMDETSPTDSPNSAVRLAGVMVAVKLRAETDEHAAVQVLELYGAKNIEKSIGEWRDGEWIDFDASAPPHLLEATPSVGRNV